MKRCWATKSFVCLYISCHGTGARTILQKNKSKVFASGHLQCDKTYNTNLFVLQIVRQLHLLHVYIIHFLSKNGIFTFSLEIFYYILHTSDCRCNCGIETASTFNLWDCRLYSICNVYNDLMKNSVLLKVKS